MYLRHASSTQLSPDTHQPETTRFNLGHSVSSCSHQLVSGEVPGEYLD